MALTCGLAYQYVRDRLLLPVRPVNRRLPTGIPAVLLTAVVALAVIFSTEPSAVDIEPAIVVQHDRSSNLVVDVAPEKGLQVRTIMAARAISAQFPTIRNIGGVRPDGLKWHPDGLALDVMIPDYRTPAGVALGDRVVAYILAHADQFALNHLIWRQVLYLPNGTVRSMANRGSEDANHVTHVHIATNGGGFPNGRETYFLNFSGAPAMAAGPAQPINVR